jgi:TonB-dependent receptor
MLLIAGATGAGEEPVHDINIPEQNAAKALEQLAEQTGAITLFPYDLAKARQTRAVVGRYTLPDALRLLLKDTGLSGGLSEKRVISITPIEADARTDEEEPVEIKKKSGLAAVLLAIFGGTSSVAQDVSDSSVTGASDEPVEEIVVTGIRGSLRRAIEIKRNSDQIVDSIASESLGKFPDTNIAESLQRITGVSIDRSGGEGQAVTVRGFGPEFNTVLMNGRRIVSDTGARSFNFDVLPAELISRVDVYKSAVVSLEEGGIGSTIVLHTPRPLDLGGFRSVVSAKGLYEELAEETTPQLFGMISNTFADDRAGFLLSASYQERNNRIERFLTDGYLTAPRDSMSLIADDLAGAGFSADDQFFIPQNLNVSPIDAERERTTVNATLQFQPSDSLTLTVDGMYNEFHVFSSSDTLGFFVTPSIITDAEFDVNRTATRITQTVDAAVDFILAERDRPTETNALGFNVDWAASDTLNVSFDTSWSRAESGGADETNVAVVGFRRQEDIYTLGYAADGFPSVTGIVDQDIVDPSLPQAHFTLRGAGGGPLGGAEDFEDELFEERIDAEWELDNGPLRRVSFGAFYSDEEQSATTRLSDNNILCLYCGYFVDVPDGILQPLEVAGYLGGDLNIPPAWQTFNMDELIGFLESPEAAAARDAAQGLPPGTTAAELAASNGYEIHVRSNSSRIEEKITSAYTDADFEGTINDLPWRLNAGLRFVRTETTAFGISQALEDLVSSGDPTLFTPILGETMTVSQTNTYNEWLPSVNFRLNATDDVIVRFAASRTMTRPPLGALSPRVVIGTTRPGNLQASSGNPNLEPFTSTNFDLSFEWYYQENGFFTLGLFRKDVDNFLVNTVENRPFPIPDSDDLFEGDPVFEVGLQDNLESAEVDGIEIAFQHTFDWLPGLWRGLGITANATLVDSNAELDVEDVAQTFALEGLGDSYNVIGFYEEGPFEARLAWNRRDRFLQSSVGFGGEPTFVTDFEQIDARVGFAVRDGLVVFAEAVNVTDERTKKVGRFRNQILLLEETGPRYTVGIRAEF